MSGCAARPVTGSFVDEIGIEIGIYGDWRLKAAFRPVFARAQGGFRPVAVECSSRPFVLGREVEQAVFRTVLPVGDRPTVLALEAALCMRNLEHTGVHGLKLLIEAEWASGMTSGRARAAVRTLVAEARRRGLDAGQLVVQLSRLAALDPKNAEIAQSALSANGVLIALEESGAGLGPDGLPQSGFPDIVVIDADWFGPIVRQRSAARLFAALVDGYRRRGAIVLLQGIANAAELDAAIASGADWLSGPLLAPTALAGAIFPDDTLQIRSLLDQRRVVPLFR